MIEAEYKKLGILGGTFNPIHVGHLMLAEWAKQEFCLDHILFIPSGCSYMKRENGCKDSQERLEMVRLAIQGRPDFSSSDMEIRRGGFTYTCETIRRLREKHPNTELYFILGADSLFSIERWRHPEEILKNCTLVAAAREGYGMQELKAKCRELETHFHGKVRLMEFGAMDVSSSCIRDRIRAGKSIRYLVPESVRVFIEEKKLYVEKR